MLDCAFYPRYTTCSNACFRSVQTTDQRPLKCTTRLPWHSNFQINLARRSLSKGSARRRHQRRIKPCKLNRNWQIQKKYQRNRKKLLQNLQRSPSHMKTNKENGADMKRRKASVKTTKRQGSACQEIPRRNSDRRNKRCKIMLDSVR
jgi:hypothetical protein